LFWEERGDYRRSVVPKWDIEDLNRYVDDNRRQPLATILAGLEEHGLWRGTPFESAHTFAELVEEQGGFERSFGRVLNKVLALAAQIVRERGGDPEASPLALLDMACLLSRVFLVEGIVGQINSAETN
jgi:hypothetical protein